MRLAPRIGSQTTQAAKSRNSGKTVSSNTSNKTSYPRFPIPAWALPILSLLIFTPACSNTGSNIKTASAPSKPTAKEQQPKKKKTKPQQQVPSQQKVNKKPRKVIPPEKGIHRLPPEPIDYPVSPREGSGVSEHGKNKELDKLIKKKKTTATLQRSLWSKRKLLINKFTKLQQSCKDEHGEGYQKTLEWKNITKGIAKQQNEQTVHAFRSEDKLAMKLVETTRKELIKSGFPAGQLISIESLEKSQQR